MKDYELFKAFVNVIQAVDLSDEGNMRRVRRAMNELDEQLKRRGYDFNKTWEEALKEALS